MRRLQIAVIGAGRCGADVARLAEELGAAIAERGCTLVCGGLAGVMEAAARGARSRGGLTVGVLPSYDTRTANPELEVVLPTGMGHARNVIVVSSGDAVIALPGEHGTAAEIALALKIGRAVIGLRAWAEIQGVESAASPAEAVERAVARAERAARLRTD
jgi:uncharacterized protein (TIGR00725 family)